MQNRNRKHIKNALLSFGVIASMLGTLAGPASIGVLAAEQDVNALPETITNGDFETGNLDGWTTLDGAPAANNNVGVVSGDEKYWEGSMADRYFYKQGTYFLRGDSKEGVSGGAIRSTSFRLGGDGYISFKIGAASQESKGSVKVYRVNAGSDELIKTYTNSQWKDPETGLTLLRVYDDLSDYLGEELYFVVENGTDTAGFAFINVDDFRTSLTSAEVEQLQQDEMAEAEKVNDQFKEYILNAYKANQITDYIKLVKEIAATVTKRDGDTVNIPKMLEDATKAEKASTHENVPVTIDVTGITYDGQAVKEDPSNLTLKEGSYTVAYTVTYNKKTEEKSFEIKVMPVGYTQSDVINGNFETGDLTGWTLLDGGSAEGNNVGVVTNDEKYWEDSMPNRYFYKEGDYFLRGDSKEAVSGGAIRSSSFTLGGDGYITFKIGAAKQESKGSVKVYQEGSDTPIRTYTNEQWKDPATGLTLLRKYDDLSEYIGKELYFVVENGTDTSGFAFINVDDFRASLTADEVKELQQEQIKEIQDIPDSYKSSIIDAYKSYVILDYVDLVKEIAAAVPKYVSNVINIPELISSSTKAQMAYSGDKVPVEVTVNSVEFEGKAVAGDFAAFTLENEGQYTVNYTLVYGDKTEQKSFVIKASVVDYSKNDVVNGGFETGDLTGWEVIGEDVWTENQDNSQGIVSADTYWGEELPYNQEGEYHLDGWEVTGNEDATWGVRSSVFTLGGSGWVSVRMGGHAAQVKVYKMDGTLIGVFNENRFSDINFPFINKGGSWADMGTSFIDLHEYVGEQLYIELWDRKVDMWGCAFFDDLKCYYESEPDIANGFDMVEAPVGIISSGEDEPTVYEYGEVKLPWTQLLPPSDDVIYLSFDEDTGYTVKNAYGPYREDNLEGVLKNPQFQDTQVEPYRPKGVSGKALNFDGYSNSASFNGSVEGSKLTVDVYVCPRVFTWSGPETPREEHLAHVFAGNYSTAAKSGFLVGVTKHGYLTFRVGTGNKWYNLVGEKDSKISTYEWSRVTAVFDGDAGKMSLYLNGQSAGELAIEEGSEIASAGSTILVGKGSEAVLDCETFDMTSFAGLMDELKISLTAQTAEEVAAGGLELPEISYEDAMTPDSALVGDYFRPQYHAVPSGNWMNEPHALFQYNNKWHLFYQFNPAGPYWHNISWGHWVSDDMVNWEFVKEAVIPTEDTITPDGVWTGNVIFTKDGEPLLLITAGDDSRPVNGSNQHVGLVRAVDYDDPELTEWEVIGYAMAQTAEMGTPSEFRDAQAFGIGDDRYMVVGGDIGRKGVAHVFKTKAKTLAEWEAACSHGELNGMQWEYKGSLLGDFFDSHEYKAEYGQVWEMPNIVPLSYKDGRPSGKYLFVFSPQHGDNEAWYYIGNFDTNTCRFTPDFADAKLIDYGNNVFTGPTVYLNPDDQKVYICSIMQDGDRSFADRKNSGWAFYAGLPRELYLKEDGTLGISNIDTSTAEGEEIVSFKNLTAAEANEKLKAVNSDTIKIEFEFSGNAGEVGFNLKKSGAECTRLYLKDGKLGLDGNSGTYQRGSTVKGVVYVDKCSIEAYIDDSIAVSGTKYLRGTGLEVVINGDARCSVTVTEMNSIHKEKEVCAHPNTEIKNVKEATCTENGYTGDTICKDCGTVMKKGVVLPAVGHVYESEVTKEPTQTETGVRTYTCTRCGDTYTEEIPKLTQKPSFEDVLEEEWYYQDVCKVYEEGWMTGKSETRFAPEQILTRAEFATILYRMAGEPKVTGESRFTDVAQGTYYTSAAEWASSVGVITGYGGTKLFGPDDPITREQIATMLYRYAKYQGKDTGVQGNLDKFADSSSVSEYAKDALTWCVDKGIILGVGNKTLEPQDVINRAACAALVTRYDKAK